MNCFRSRFLRHPGTLYCTLCGREIALGEEYWSCSGTMVCAGCLPVFARQEFAPCHETRGKEMSR